MKDFASLKKNVENIQKQIKFYTVLQLVKGNDNIIIYRKEIDDKTLNISVGNMF